MGVEKCMHIHVITYVHAYVRTYVYAKLSIKHIHTYICTYVRMYTCMEKVIIFHKNVLL